MLTFNSYNSVGIESLIGIRYPETIGKSPYLLISKAGTAALLSDSLGVTPSSTVGIRKETGIELRKQLHSFYANAIATK